MLWRRGGGGFSWVHKQISVSAYNLDVFYVPFLVLTVVWVPCIIVFSPKNFGVWRCWIKLCEKRGSVRGKTLLAHFRTCLVGPSAMCTYPSTCG